jgi:hypothetical protein
MRLFQLLLASCFLASAACSSGAGTEDAAPIACTGSGRFIVAGFTVVTAYPSDGTTTGLSEELRNDIYDGLAYGNGRVVALGIGGRVLVSDDRGVTFTSADGSSGIESYEALFRRNRFLAVGRDLASTNDAPRSLVVASDDGETWAPIAEPLDGGSFIAFDASDDAIVAVLLPTSESSGGGALYRYTDATGWNPVTPLDGPRYGDVLHDGKSFLAIASRDPATDRGVLARSSDDGVTFELSDMDTGFVGLTFDAGRYLASGFKRVAISEDLTTWRLSEFEAPSTRPEDAERWYFYKMAHDGCNYLAAGGLHGWNAQSSDGMVWTDQLGPTHGSLLEVIHVPEE